MENPKLKLSDSKILKKFSIWKRLFEREKDSHIHKINEFCLSYSQNNNKLNNDENNIIDNHNSSSIQNIIDRNKLTNCIENSKNFLINLRENDEYWNARLDSNIGLNAQYILLKYFLGIDIHTQRDQKIIQYIINNQQQDGSWNIYENGPGHLSYSITSYFALKLYGYSPDEPIMERARSFILKEGGIKNANVETKFWLALFDQYSWEGLPPIPVQILLAPNSFVFSIYNISYWCRVSLVPMSVLYNKKMIIKPPKHAYIDELYVNLDEKKDIRFDIETKKLLSLENILIRMSKAAKLLEKASPEILDKIALKKAKDWILHHQDDSGDWGGIYPAMQYSIMALKVFGYSNNSPEIKRGLEALERFQIETENDIMLSACTSPVWDTGWSLYALNNLGFPIDDPIVDKAISWLYSQQIFREGDWCIKNPDALPAAWCFQFYNDFYPDTDDTAVVLMSIIPSLREIKYHEPFKLSVIWLLSMQNNDGGWGAFERNVDKEIMNYLPLNDIKNFLDESTADVTGRILELLGKLGFTIKDPVIQRAVRFLRDQQEDFGAWYGRWGVNYIYGTWSVIRGLESVKENMTEPYIQKAIKWLKSHQNENGGWGESCLSYEDLSHAGVGKSTASQTAWAVMTLISSGETQSIEVQRGIQYFIDSQNDQGGWDEKEYTGTGFERAFYLKYYYYPYYFPILALGTYCKLSSSNNDQ